VAQEAVTVAKATRRERWRRSHPQIFRKYHGWYHGFVSSWSTSHFVLQISHYSDETFN